jgi:hypothetical protein
MDMLSVHVFLFFSEPLCLFVARKPLTNPGRGPAEVPIRVAGAQGRLPPLVISGNFPLVHAIF